MWNIAGASIPGSDHTMPGKPGWKNNQDARYLHNDDRVTIGIVADGCGSGEKSEVGASLGVRIFGELLKFSAYNSLDSGSDSITDWERLRMLLLGHISVVANTMKGVAPGASLSDVIKEYFLFSLVGFILLPKTCTVFYCGDGAYAVNGEIKNLGPFLNNAPPYLSYGILGHGLHVFETISFPVESITSIAVGTDGVDYMSNLEGKLSEWIATDAVFSNPDVLRRKLAMINLEKIEDSILKPGPLKDDITIVLARRAF